MCNVKVATCSDKTREYSNTAVPLIYCHHSYQSSFQGQQGAEKSFIN